MTAENLTQTREIESLHFGRLQLDPEYVYRFDEGILGFEELKEFVLVSDDNTVPFKWLVSTESPDIGLPLISPWLIDLGYKPGRHAQSESDVAFVVVTLSKLNGMTANMKAPIVLNTEQLSGKQVILPSDKYQTEHRVVPASKN
ncbi:MAG: flagellar assembly protein FliW [Candidatus Kapaibacteriales bacterium]